MVELGPKLVNTCLQEGGHAMEGGMWKHARVLLTVPVTGMLLIFSDRANKRSC